MCSPDRSSRVQKRHASVPRTSTSRHGAHTRAQRARASAGSFSNTRASTSSGSVAKPHGAPASAGNDPVTYASNIADAVGLSPSDSLAAAISQSGGGAPAGGSDLSDVGGDITSYVTQGLQDLSDAVDLGGGVDLSAIGLGVVDPSVLIIGGIAVLLALWVATRE